MDNSVYANWFGGPCWPDNRNADLRPLSLMLRPSRNTANGHNDNMKVDRNSAKAATIEHSHDLTLRNLRELTGRNEEMEAGMWGDKF